jgi:hypothetical protein
MADSSNDNRSYEAAEKGQYEAIGKRNLLVDLFEAISAINFGALKLLSINMFSSCCCNPKMD